MSLNSAWMTSACLSSTRLRQETKFDSPPLSINAVTDRLFSSPENRMKRRVGHDVGERGVRVGGVVNGGALGYVMDGRRSALGGEESVLTMNDDPPIGAKQTATSPVRPSQPAGVSPTGES